MKSLHSIAQSLHIPSFVLTALIARRGFRVTTNASNISHIEEHEAELLKFDVEEFARVRDVPETRREFLAQRNVRGVSLAAIQRRFAEFNPTPDLLRALLHRRGVAVRDDVVGSGEFSRGHMLSELHQDLMEYQRVSTTPGRDAKAWLGCTPMGTSLDDLCHHLTRSVSHRYSGVAEPAVVRELLESHGAWVNPDGKIPDRQMHLRSELERDFYDVAQKGVRSGKFFPVVEESRRPSIFGLGYQNPRMQERAASAASAARAEASPMPPNQTPSAPAAPVRVKYFERKESPHAL